MNNMPGYTCICDDGYGGMDCSVEDVNECKVRPCSPFADCINTLGGYKCECRTGYVGDGFSCDISNDITDKSQKETQLSSVMTSCHIDNDMMFIDFCSNGWVLKKDSLST